ncbi:MAG: hypothetical protein JNL41_11850 [Phenylobacterium sp.]|uniref:hypothetical protein n=1 Tax=Phenylobacterium sp. TaxID=1871053 RepID=UPI001A58242B|nr:hypothetical protein [Phenylobacterium sp.]MBL8554964.1 hypothetical protein [Phenylobacterium sp.]
MTVRRTFLLLVVPLFLALAAVNGALLYVWEKTEARRGLEGQAIAAAVTTAAFAAGSDDLAVTLADPRRAAALAEAAASIEGLEGLYVVDPEGTETAIAGRAPHVSKRRIGMPTAATVLPVRTALDGRRIATAVAPAERGRYVIAEIDAEPLYARLAKLRRIIAGVVAGAGAVGLALALSVAGRIDRELAVNSALIASDDAAAEAAALSIRETRDLANAVRLMRTSVSGRLSRSARELALNDRRRTEAVAVAAYRAEALPPVVATAAGVRVAVRALGAAPAGAFAALCVVEDRAALALGEAAGDGAAEALAMALAARGFFERALLDGDPAARAEQGRAAFGLDRVAWTAWTAGSPPPQTLGLLDGDNDARAAAYARQTPGLAPEAVLDDLAALLEATGMVAVLRPSREGGQS